MPRQRLRPHAARSAIARLAEELGRADRARLQALAPLIEADGQIPLAAALAALYPDKQARDALASLRQFRLQLRRAAAEASIELALIVDTRRRSRPEDRHCWLEGIDTTAEQAARLSREEATAAQPASPVTQDAIALGETRNGKPVVRYFVSYTRKDERLKDDLLARLQLRFDCAKSYAFEPWQDGDILPGENWHQAIQRAIADCHFGLLLVSYGFLSRPYIRTHELPRFVSQDPDRPAWRLAVPVGLRKMQIGAAVDMKGLEHRQIFRHRERFFSEYRGEQTRDDFADALFSRILTLVERHMQAPGTAPAAPIPGPGVTAERLPRSARLLAERYGKNLWYEMDRDGLVAPEGAPASLEKGAEGTDPSLTGERVEALGFLHAWATDPGAPPFCALLGEYGMGKITTCKAFTERLLDARRDAPELPLPLYFDLRHLGDHAKAEPTVTAIIGEIVRRSWHGGREIEGLDAAELIRLVQEDGALAIFDGLDEVLVHLDPTAGQRFTRELWRVLPPGRTVKAEDRRPGKLLVSCRTHYFRTLREQKTHLTGEDREGIRPADYRALVLLPFTEAQVRVADLGSIHLEHRDAKGLEPEP